MDTMQAANRALMTLASLVFYTGLAVTLFGAFAPGACDLGLLISAAGASGIVVGMAAEGE